jgi:anti-anti-sigma factor
MQLEHISQQNIDFIRLPTRVLLADSQVLKCALFNLILSAPKPCLAIDMGEVEFIDSTGLAVLVKCLNVCRRRKGDVCLFNLQSTTKTLFQITSLCSVIPIVERRQDAIALLSCPNENDDALTGRLNGSSPMAAPCS